MKQKLLDKKKHKKHKCVDQFCKHKKHHKKHRKHKKHHHHEVESSESASNAEESEIKSKTEDVLVEREAEEADSTCPNPEDEVTMDDIIEATQTNAVSFNALTSFTSLHVQ